MATATAMGKRQTGIMRFMAGLFTMPTLEKGSEKLKQKNAQW
jgi:hypothetical protein